ncbi:MAG: hypothetical protein A2V70_15860 [Planctomycetes bacterium RBG_13_63_9]|nr:MAG: hypothetical protein A2V70_15860 [Planctomycetes bacterium RBG_13_63_9]
MLEDEKAFFKREFHPGPLPSARRIGLELEFPVTMRCGRAVRREIINALLESLCELGFRPLRDEVTAAVVGAEGDFAGNDHLRAPPRDRVDMEVGYCTIEVALAPETTLHSASRRLEAATTLLAQTLASDDALLLGYGIQPVQPPHRDLLAPKGIFGLYERCSGNAVVSPRDGVDIHLFAITAAAHYHFDISREEAATALNVLNGLAGLLIALCANSPIWLGKADESSLAVRETFYDVGMTNWLGRFGNPDRFSNLDHYIERLAEFPPIAVRRDGEYLRVRNCQSLQEYYSGSVSIVAEHRDGSLVQVSPSVEDMALFARMWWHNARLSPLNGTIEARSVCQQPPGEAVAPAALIMGILEDLEGAVRILDEYPWSVWQRLRVDAVKHGLDARILGSPIHHHIERLLLVAEAGLRRRNNREEHLLSPLQDRLARRQCPANRVLALFRAHGLDGLLDGVAYRGESPAE